MINRSILLVLVIFILVAEGFSQTKISGIVLMEGSGKPIPYVNIAVLGKTTGTVSNQNGEFNLSIKDLARGDTLGFYYVGLEPVLIGYDKLYKGMVVNMVEKIVDIPEVSISGRSYTGRELLDLALENKPRNYAPVRHFSEIFRRTNNATYVEQFDLALNKSTMPEVDQGLAQAIEDSMIRYSRNFTDHLYKVYFNPNDTIMPYGISRGVKKIVLDEEIGGEFEQIEERLEELLGVNAEGVFWKLKTGPISGKLNDPKETEDDKEKTVQEMENWQKRRDSLELHRPYRLLEMNRINEWNWDFIRKPGRYSYTVTGYQNIQGEICYVVSFNGRIRSDYQGKLFISSESFAILRIEYQLKGKKAENGIKLLGVHYNEPDDSGLFIYAKDSLGYYLKYSLKQSSTEFWIVRPFQLIQKVDKPIFNRRLNRIDLHLNLGVRSEESLEFLTVKREALSPEEYGIIEPFKVNPEEINEYSDDLWKDYSIIEPTKQMKEYRTQELRQNTKDQR